MKKTILSLTVSTLLLTQANADWKEMAKKWTPDIESSTINKLNKNATTLSTFTDDKNKANLLLGTVNQFGGDFVSPEQMGVLSAGNAGFNLYMNDNLEDFLSNDAISGLMPDGMDNFLDFCYKKKPVTPSGTSLDLCSMIPDADSLEISIGENPCDSPLLPSLPGYTKLDTPQLELQKNIQYYADKVNSVTSFALSPLDMLKDKCNSMKTSTNISQSPKTKTSLTEKIKNADPTGSAKHSHLINSNTNVKEIMNSGVMNPGYLESIEITVETQDEDGNPVNKKVKPYKGISDFSKPENKQAYAHLTQLAKDSGLEGGSPEEVSTLYKTLALHKSKVNTSFETPKYQNDALTELVSEQTKLYISVTNTDYLIEKALISKAAGDLKKTEIIEITLEFYMKDVQKLESFEIEALKKERSIKNPMLTKDAINKRASNSQNELITRLSLIADTDEEMRLQAKEIVAIKEKSNTLMKKLEYKLIVALNIEKWEDRQVAVQRQLGFKEEEIIHPPQGGSVDEMVSNKIETNTETSMAMQTPEIPANLPSY